MQLVKSRSTSAMVLNSYEHQIQGHPQISYQATIKITANI